MLSKINNKTLAIIFIGLIILVVLTFVVDFGNKERTFRDTLVDIDTSAVTQVLIYPKSQNHREVKLFKEDGSWNVILENGKIASVSPKKISELFQQLASIKPKRLAAKGESKWAEFQVDSTGSRVKVFEDDKLVLNIIIGRFSFQQPRSMNTFVRLHDDKDIYEVEGFLDMTFNQSSNIFRDGTIISDDFNSWTQLQFNYPADSSFTIIKNNNVWFINGVKTDSAKTINILRRLSNLTTSAFADDFDINTDAQPDYTLSISSKDLKFIELKAYHFNNKVTLISSQNPNTVLDVSSLMTSIFPGQSFFKSN